MLVNWFVREGAQVRAGQILAEIGVEKTALEVPAPAAGILMKVEVDENGIFNWGDALAWIETEGTS
ncbi:MAG: lipoyl domain-containing protein [Gammaproteobacteria bacterium]|nr:lipoyl domain-containing protein [Gammaproteobacteria bacterium]